MKILLSGENFRSAITPKDFAAKWKRAISRERWPHSFEKNDGQSPWLAQPETEDALRPNSQLSG
jgi:hypothetical protein